MARMANGKQAALARARERRVVLDRDRAARDGRVEQAAARVFLLTERQSGARQVIAQADAGIGRALRELATDGVTVDGIAELCELQVADVRRLLRTRPGDETGQDTAVCTSGPAVATGLPLAAADTRANQAVGVAGRAGVGGAGVGGEVADAARRA